MKFIRCDGKIYEVYDVQAPIVRLLRRPGGIPIKAHGSRLLEDNEARAELRELLDSELYDREL